MAAAYTHPDPQETTKSRSYRRRCRGEAASHLRRLHEAQASGKSERAHAQKVGIPRTTMRSWEQRRRELQAQGAPEFFQTKEGVEWASRLVWALMFVMSLRCPAGLRCICEVLELSGLDAVVAGSFGTLQSMAVTLHGAVDDVGAELQQDLANQCAKRGPPGRITVCEDETFHPGVCLVATEPASNFIFVEEYAQRRDASTWTTVMEKAMLELPFKVVQSTSDEAVALKKHAREGLDSHHSPDLFHVQHELVKGTSLVLRGRERRATEALVKALGAVRKAAEKLSKSKSKRRHRDGPKKYIKSLDQAERAERRARQVAEQCAADREAMSEAIRGVSQVYHPYDLATGRARTAADLRLSLTESFSKINEIADKISLSAKCRKCIDKAARVVDSMLETISWTHTEVDLRLSVVEPTADERVALMRFLIPGRYIGLVAAKAQTADERSELQETADRLTAEFAATTNDWPGFTTTRNAELARVALGCAQAFQRSSSCVEGRNGHLALFHHGIHRLTPSKLRALTVTHNFHITRGDGSTPAERLFGLTHAPLFETVLGRLPMWPRPARKRSVRRRRGGALEAA